MASQTLETLILINAQAGSGFAQVGSTLMQMGRLVQQLTGGLKEFFEESMGTYKTYETNMAEARFAMAANYGRDTKELDQAMDNIENYVQNLAKNTQFTTEEASAAANAAAHAMNSDAEVINALNAARVVAISGNMQLDEAMDMTIQVMKAMGIPMEQMAQFTDHWAYAANHSAGDIQSFGEAMMQMGSTMRFAANPDEILVMIGAIQNMGETGSASGTMLRNAMLRLLAPTKSAAEQLEELGATEEEISEALGDEWLSGGAAEALASIGFTAYDANGNAKPMIQTFSELGLALATMAGGWENIAHNEQTMAILKSVFGQRAITGANDIIMSLQEINGLYDEMQSGAAEGYADYGMGLFERTLEVQEKLMESKWDALSLRIGETFKEPLEQVYAVAGDIADTFTNMDPTAFSMLAEGLGAISLTGGGLFTAGMALRLMSGLFTTKAGWLALGAVAIAGLAGAMAALNRSAAEYQEHQVFGDMSLDIEALQSSLGEMETPFDESRTVVDAYAENVEKAAKAYSDAATAFSQEITIQALQLEPLSEAEIANLQRMGAEMLAYVQNGIRMAQSRDTSFVNELFGISSEADLDLLSEADRSLYDTLITGWDSLYEGLYGKAQEIGGKISGLLNDALAGKDIDRSALLDLLNEYNEIMAEIADYEFQAEQNKLLYKSQRVSADSAEEWLSYLEGRRASDFATREDFWDTQMAQQQALYDRGYITEAEWQAEQERIAQARMDDLRGVDEGYGQYARTAVQALYKDSAFADAFEFVDRALQEGNAWFDQAGALQFSDTAFEGMSMRELSELAQQFNMWRSFGPRFDELLQGYEYDEDIAPYRNLYRGIQGGDFVDQLNAADREYRERQENTPGGVNEYGQEYTASDISAMSLPDLKAYLESLAMYMNMNGEALAGGGKYADLYKQAYDRALSLGAVEDNLVKFQGFDQYVASLPGGGAQAAPAAQEQTANVIADTTSAQTAIAGLNGTEITANVNGDVGGLSSAIDSQDGRSISVNVNGNLSGIQSQLNSLTAHVSVSMGGGGAGKFGANYVRGAYGEGGRAIEASIFGEAGPEWAIPEEHSPRTAELLDAARAASGFTWGELIDLYGGLNAEAGREKTTVVYSPTINAVDATGVQAVLKEDKKRLEKWMEERALRDRIEVYA